MKAREILKRFAPVLYDKIFYAVLKRVFNEAWENLPEGTTLEIVAFGLGVVVGTVGKAAAKGKFSLFGLLFVVAEQIVIRTSTGIIPNSLKIAEENYRKMADQILIRLSAAGVHLTERDMRRIYEEIQKRPAEIRKALNDMIREFGS